MNLEGYYEWFGKGTHKCTVFYYPRLQFWSLAVSNQKLETEKGWEQGWFSLSEWIQAFIHAGPNSSSDNPP